MMKPNIGITENNLQKSTTQLSMILADEMTLYVKTRKFHWNINGYNFMELHKLFQDQYSSLEETIDQVAERISKLGCNTIGTMQEFLAQTRLKESPEEYPSQKDMIRELLGDHESLIQELRKNITDSSEKSKDAGTIDFMTGIMEEHETMAWVLRRYVN